MEFAIWCGDSNTVEEMISNAFQDFTTEKDKSCAGSGFSTITSACKVGLDKKRNTEEVYSTMGFIYQKSLTHLTSL